MVVELWSIHFVILITTVFVIAEYVSNLALDYLRTLQSQIQ